MYPDAELSEAEQALQTRVAPESPPGLMESSGEEASLAGSSPRVHAHVLLGVRQRVASCSRARHGQFFGLGALTQIMDIGDLQRSYQSGTAQTNLVFYTLLWYGLSM